MQITITDDIKNIEKTLNDFEKKVLPKAIVRSLNDTAKKVRTAVKRELADEMGLTQKFVNRRLHIRRATRNHLVAEVVGRGRMALKLTEFKSTKQLKKGVVSKAWGTRKVYPGTFIAVVGNGHKGAFRKVNNRIGSYKQRKNRKGLSQVQAGVNKGQTYARALPIKELYGPSLPKTMLKASVEKVVKREVGQLFPRYLRRNLNFYVSKL